MAKARTIFNCQHCGSQTPKWVGRCPECGKWDSMVEERIGGEAETQPLRAANAVVPQPITQAASQDAQRVSTGIGELDRILGGGIVPGSVILLGGEPGIGKSTIVLQLLAKMAQRADVLYASGEESVSQIRMRAERLGAMNDRLFLLTETDTAALAATAAQRKPAVMVVDSIQTLRDPELSGAPGSVGQVRESAGRLTAMAKKERIPILLVGHITKEGSIAGPKMLEHMVDTVLYFEGDRGHDYRMIRVIKNRFGPTGELALFEMGEAGLTEVSNPSEWLLEGRPSGVGGSAITAAVEGTRPILVEIQALVSPVRVQGMIPRRVTSGIDPARLSLIVAVLERRCGFRCGDADIFVKVSGGVRLEEPSADLALAAALASSATDIPLVPSDCFFGEVGLAGDIRPASRTELRLAEAERLGFGRVWTALTKERVGSKKSGSKGLERMNHKSLTDFFVALGLLSSR